MQLRGDGRDKVPMAGSVKKNGDQSHNPMLTMKFFDMRTAGQEPAVLQRLTCYNIRLILSRRPTATHPCEEAHNAIGDI